MKKYKALIDNNITMKKDEVVWTSLCAAEGLWMFGDPVMKVASICAPNAWYKAQVLLAYGTAFKVTSIKMMSHTANLSQMLYELSIWVMLVMMVVQVSYWFLWTLMAHRTATSLIAPGKRPAKSSLRSRQT